MRLMDQPEALLKCFVSEAVLLTGVQQRNGKESSQLLGRVGDTRKGERGSSIVGGYRDLQNPEKST
uniref:Uncharacterized protein n=1 Tax=Salix viminalis TaxID=40686 RepID=A0A6N2NJP4_SALVM